MARDENWTPKISQADWSGIPFYVVGTTTGNVLRNMPASAFTPSSRNIIGEGSGTGEALAKVIIDDQRSRASGVLPLLYLTGDKNRDTLPTLIKAAGFELEPLQVYATRGSPSFSAGIEGLFRHHQPLGEYPLPRSVLDEYQLTAIYSHRSHAMVYCVFCTIIYRIRVTNPTRTPRLLLSW